jgi:hypothetical protein
LIQEVKTASVREPELMIETSLQREPLSLIET